MPPLTCTILDDYQNAALTCADWSALHGRVELARFDRAFADEDSAAAALAGFDIIVAMRERTPFPASLLARLPRLKLLITTGMRNRSIDLAAARHRGITVCGTRGCGHPAAELAWAALLAHQRNLPRECANLRANGPWQIGLGQGLAGRSIGIVGLGKVGARVARYALAFEMQVAGWTRTDLPARAGALGIAALDLPELFAGCDIVMIQLALTAQTRGLIGRELLARMKPGAVLVNTARGPIVDQDALIAALRHGPLGSAVLDVFDTEPLPPDHPFRTLPNVTATPHIGYVTQENYDRYYSDAVADILAWLDGAPIRELQ